MASLAHKILKTNWNSGLQDDQHHELNIKATNTQHKQPYCYFGTLSTPQMTEETNKTALEVKPTKSMNAVVANHNRNLHRITSRTVCAREIMHCQKSTTLHKTTLYPTSAHRCRNLLANTQAH